MNSFCRFLSNGYSFTESKEKLIIKPCCWFTKGVDYNSHQQAREEWNNINSWTPGCRVCQQTEEATGNSFRLASFDIIPDSASGPAALDISLDFNCNAACVICGPEYSSTWAQQLKKHSIQIYQQPKSLDHLITVLNNIDLSDVRRIKFFGGEPLLTDTHIKILEKIPNPEVVDIWYTTNGSIMPNKELISLWERFKLVYFEVSIDGVGDKFKYIRWPLTWEKIKNNLIDLRSAAPVNLLFRINHTLNPFNVLYYDELEKWVNSELPDNRQGDPTEINIHPCWGTWDLSRTPESLRQLVYKKYGNDHSISVLIKNMPVLTYQPIIDHTNTWDRKRNVRWQSIFPELVDYFP